MKMGNAGAPRTVNVNNTVGDAANLISPANANYILRSFLNTGAVSIFLGKANVAATGANKGREVKAGEQFNDDATLGAWYAIAASGTVDVNVIEVLG